MLCLPSWRTADELTLVRPRGDGKGNEIVRYNLTPKASAKGKVYEATVISRNWPIAVTEGWLEKE